MKTVLYVAAFAGLILAVLGATATAQNPNPTWMQDLKPRIGYLQLNQVVLPGTHDSGTNTLDKTSPPAQNSPIYNVEGDIDSFFSSDWCTVINVASWPLELCSKADDAIDDFINKTVNPTFVAPWAQAQDQDIPYQLNQGIRFFDIRPCPYPPSYIGSFQEFRVCHGLFGESIQTELEDVQTFSSANTDEIIVLSISHETANDITGDLDSELAQQIISTLSTMLIPPPPVYSPTTTLSELWAGTGRVIVLYDHDALGALPSSYQGYLWDGDYYYTPWPNLDGTYVSKKRIYFNPGMVDEPSPLFPVNLKQAVMQNLTCGNHIAPVPTCNPVGTSSSTCQSWDDNPLSSPPFDDGQCWAQAGVPQMFALQTQPTDAMDLVGGRLFADILANSVVNDAKNACDAVLPRNYNCGAALSDLRQDKGFAFGSTSWLPGNLHTLDQYGNAVILQNLTTWITDTPALRQNLNIVLADYFEQTSNFIPNMILLNTPPESTLSIGNPQYDCPTNCFVASRTPLSISATDSNFGISSIDYGINSTCQGPTGQGCSVESPGGSAVEFEITGADGPYTVNYFATNLAGLWGSTNTQLVKLDNTPPVITIIQPTATTYPHSAVLTLNYNANDGTGSGVASVTPTMDGKTTVGGQGLASGQAINLLTEMALGTHTFTVGAVDNVSNVSTPVSVTFTIIVTPQSIMGDVSEFESMGWITPSEAAVLLNILNFAAQGWASGSCAWADFYYYTFISQVSAQSGLTVNPTAAAIMIGDANYLIATCP
jgi:hypothetical protein